jgi:hypothetical protein
MSEWRPDLSSLVDRVATAVGDAAHTIEVAELQTGQCPEYDRARDSVREAGEHLAVAMYAGVTPNDQDFEAICRAWEAIARAQDIVAKARALTAQATAQRAWALETRAYAQQQAVIARARAGRIRLSWKRRQDAGPDES